MINFTEFCVKLRQCGVSSYIVKTLTYLYGQLTERNREYFCVRINWMLNEGHEEFYMDINDTTEDIKLMDEIMDLLDGWVFNVQAKELCDSQVRCWELYSLLPAED